MICGEPDITIVPDGNQFQTYSFTCPDENRKGENYIKEYVEPPETDETGNWLGNLISYWFGSFVMLLFAPWVYFLSLFGEWQIMLEASQSLISAFASPQLYNFYMKKYILSKMNKK